MKCLECNGRGFIEYESGVIMIECEVCLGTGEVDDSNSGIGQPDSDIGSADTSQPQLKSKPKSKKKATKRAK